MKIRDGFVSNSSSSSFIVAFPYAPKSKDDVKSILFGEDDDTIEYFDYSLSIDKIARQVWHDIKRQKAIDRRRLINNIYEHFMAKEDWSIFKGMGAEYAWVWPQMNINDFLNLISSEHLYEFYYSDHTPDGIVLENGEIFNKLPHIRESHH